MAQKIPLFVSHFSKVPKRLDGCEALFFATGSGVLRNCLRNVDDKYIFGVQNVPLALFSAPIRIADDDGAQPVN